MKKRKNGTARPERLSVGFVRNVTQPGRYGDGRGGYGLSLLVKPTSVPGRLSKTWNQRLIINKEPRSIGLGSYPVVELDEAREQALLNKRALARGEDPRRKVSDVPTFKEAAEKVIEVHRPTWKGDSSLKDWALSFSYVFPVIGDVPVSQITTSHVLDVLTPIWTEKPGTAKKVKSRISAVMKWAVGQGFRGDDPAGDAISAALPKKQQPVKHRKALPYVEVEAALETIRQATDVDNLPATLGMRFLTLTAVRPGEVLGMTWDEVDLEAATWTIPAERMKTSQAHRVPLSEQAMKVLKVAKRESRGGSFVFAYSDSRLWKGIFQDLLNRLKIKANPHGFRSSFRDWAAERSGMPKEIAELALAHVRKDKVEAAYLRTDQFEQRRQLMQSWANFVAPKG